MTDEELLNQQEVLQKEGKDLLDEIGLINFLSKFGQIEIGGSFDSGLMVWRDIDMGVFAEEINEEHYWEMVKFLFDLEEYYHSLYIQDFRKSVNPNSPKGLYIGIKIKYLENMWKIDVWYVNSRRKDEFNFNEWLKGKLNEQNRKIILMLKNQIQNNPKYRKEIFAVDVYKAVIEKGVIDLAGFKKYIHKTGRSLD